MKTLAEIYEKYRDITDKGSDHSYIEWYEERLAPMRDWHMAVLEIGVSRGGSLMMWRDYFPNAVVHGIDVQHHGAAADLGDRVQTHLGNAAQPHIYAQAELPKMSLIIDDGSHQLHDVLMTFACAKKHLKAEGLYIIEDIQSDGDAEVLLHYLHGSKLVDRRNKKGRWDDRLIEWRQEESK